MTCGRQDANVRYFLVDQFEEITFQNRFYRPNPVPYLEPLEETLQVIAAERFRVNVEKATRSQFFHNRLYAQHVEQPELNTWKFDKFFGCCCLCFLILG